MQPIKKIIKELFQAMGFNHIEVDIKKDSSLKNREEVSVINITASPEQAKYFLKENALGLNAFQHLLRILITKKNLGQTFFILDINNYKKEREKFLFELAFKAAQKVRRMKKSITLEPMSSYERRIIHLKLAEEPDIVTESTGQEPERKVVIRLYP